MRLTILSFFRDAAGSQVRRFVEQCATLRDRWQGGVRVVAVYGDCVDNTHQQLLNDAASQSLQLHAVEYNTNLPRFGSTEQPERFEAMSRLSNHGLDFVQSLLEPDLDERVFYVESDLLWRPEVVKSLSHNLDHEGIDAVAPLVFAGEHFYDVWGFRGLDGQRFAPFAPYHQSLQSADLTQISSCGSCFVMTREVLEKTRIRNKYALVGFWEDAASHGFKLYVDPTLKVRHPA